MAPTFAPSAPTRPRWGRALAVGGVGVVAVIAGACGTSSGSSSARNTGPSAASRLAAGPTVRVVTNATFGPILVDSRGFTLYQLTTDRNGVSSCTGQCATAWPALTCLLYTSDAADE